MKLIKIIAWTKCFIPDKKSQQEGRQLTLFLAKNELVCCQYFWWKKGEKFRSAVEMETAKFINICILRWNVNKVIKQCMLCRHQATPQLQPRMSLSPQKRELMYKKPFSATGIDYFVSSQMKIGRRFENRYGISFTCLTTRVFHVGVAHSPDTDKKITCKTMEQVVELQKL